MATGGYDSVSDSVVIKLDVHVCVHVHMCVHVCVRVCMCVCVVQDTRTVRTVEERTVMVTGRGVVLCGVVWYL
jgi:hypothetical protein